LWSWELLSFQIGKLSVVFDTAVRWRIITAGNNTFFSDFPHCYSVLVLPLHSVSAVVPVISSSQCSKVILCIAQFNKLKLCTWQINWSLLGRIAPASFNFEPRVISEFDPSSAINCVAPKRFKRWSPFNSELPSDHRTHCTNAWWNRCKTDLNSFPCRKLEETTGTSLY